MVDKDGNHTLVAFWKHSLYPYCLCSGIKQFNDDGTIKAVGYSGQHFKPFLVLPYAAAMKKQEQLNTLDRRRCAAIASIEKDFTCELASIISIPGIKK